MSLVNPTDAKEIALHYIGMAKQPTSKQNIIKNITIAKQILEMGYPKDSIIVAIDLYIDKMYSLGFIKCVIKEVYDAIVEQAKQDEIKDKLERIKSEKPIYKEVDAVDGSENRNRSKLEGRTNISRKRTDGLDYLFKRQ